LEKELFLSQIDFDSLKVSKEIKVKLHSKCAILAADFLPSTNKENIKHNIQIIEKLEQYLNKESQKYGVEFTKLLHFLEGYKTSSTIFECVQEDSSVPEPFLKSLQTKHRGNSVIKISKPYNYEQIKVITRQLFNEHPDNPLVFVISNKERVEGKIIGEIEQRKIKLPIAWKVQITYKDDVSYIPYIFGERIPRKNKIVDEVSGEFYLYRFLSKESKEFALISVDKLKLDDYTIEGLSIEVEDIKIIGDAYKLINKFPVFFVHTATSHICELKNHKQLFAKADALKLTGNKLYRYLSSHKKKDGIQILEHPRWFMKLLAALLFHKKKGTTTEYPLHFLWIADRGTGKSSILEAIHQKSGEIQDIIAGSSSTLKYLIPSFKETNKPDMGALAKASRLIIIDEFFRILRLNIKDKEDECGRMNDLLEHKERQAGSGQGRIKTSMTARLIGATNPIAGTNNIFNLVEKFDDSFLSRFLIYYQTDDHIRFIHKKVKEGAQTTTEWVDVNDFLSIQDYLQSFDVVYKRSRLVEIFERFSAFLSEEIKGMYEARYLHHLECLTDGIVKVRCLMTRDSSFKATEEDYKEVESIWAIVIKSWFRQNIDDLIRDDNIPKDTRIKFLPEHAMFVLRALASLGYKAKLSELKEKCREEIHPSMINFNFSLLEQGGFIREEGEHVVHYEWEEVSDK
jgi:hypothetical protein